MKKIRLTSLLTFLLTIWVNAQSAELTTQFGSQPTLQDNVDFRKDFFEYGLYPKNQGMRPSCSVFAIVSALEFQNAQRDGHGEKLSEEYLIWATRKSQGQESIDANDYDPVRDGDLGFSLNAVTKALNDYGIPSQNEMPNTFGKSMAKIPEPSESLIRSAQQQTTIETIPIPGKTNPERIANIIHVLNAGIPVVIGLRWPHYKTLRNTPRLSKQKPPLGYLHAITLVGYRDKTGRIEDTLFLFKNSWGNKWGINGHGWVTYEYLVKHLRSAMFLYQP